MICKHCGKEFPVEDMTIFMWRRAGEYDGAVLFCPTCLPPDNINIIKCTASQRMDYMLAKLVAHGVYRPSVMEAQ